MQAELAHLASPHKDPRYCPSHMNSAKMTPPILNGREEERWGREVQGSMFLGEVRREKLAGEGEVCFFSPSILRVRCLLPNWNVSCLLPPSHLYLRHRRLAPRHQRSSACPIPLSLESQGVLSRTKRKVNLQAFTARRRVAISLWGKKKKSPFFVVFLLITALCNIRKHTGTPKVLLKPASSFFLVICLEVKKKTEVETTDNKATNKNRVSVLSLGPTKQTFLMW